MSCPLGFFLSFLVIPGFLALIPVLCFHLPAPPLFALSSWVNNGYWRFFCCYLCWLRLCLLVFCSLHLVGAALLFMSVREIIGTSSPNSAGFCVCGFTSVLTTVSAIVSQSLSPVWGSIFLKLFCVFTRFLRQCLLIYIATCQLFCLSVGWLICPKGVCRCL